MGLEHTALSSQQQNAIHIDPSLNSASYNADLQEMLDATLGNAVNSWKADRAFDSAVKAASEEDRKRIGREFVQRSMKKAVETVHGYNSTIFKSLSVEQRAQKTEDTLVNMVQDDIDRMHGLGAFGDVDFRQHWRSMVDTMYDDVDNAVGITPTNQRVVAAVSGGKSR